MTSHRENPSTRARRAARIPAAALIALLLLSILAVPARARAAASTSSTAPPGFTGGEAEDADPLPDPDRQLAQYGELRFTVDPAVVPRTAEIEPVDGSRDPRPVGAIAYPDGETQEFVLDHVMLHTSSREELAGFVARWNGTVVYSTEADAEGQDHLVRVDPSGADVANLAANLRAVERHHAGEHRLSDDRALRLLALMAAELATGTEVTVDWLATSHGVAESTASESSDLPPNAFDWTYMDDKATQSIGVAQAWRLLHAKGKLGASPRLMVADGGFVKNQDWPADVTLRKTEWGKENPVPCLDSECLWHGTHSVMTAMAEIDNGYGTAGPAGPLDASAVVVGMTGSFWFDMDRLVDMVDLYRPDVVNMSFGAKFKVAIDANKHAASRRYKRMQEDGALLIASAGNEGQNVDDHTLRLPCENGRVMCVGGMQVDSRVVHGGSN